ncbi:MAG: hypothetical protein JO225_05195 [Candidatus Eremiobacteraeota bacterium]|nr:hypothetical protein [Candidatus Eremiobacteraeota bacterium]MBV8643293.1 hypothetical protein [Candidatus Eremiobacteraeota bacterium]
MSEGGKFLPDLILRDESGSAIVVVEVKNKIQDVDRPFFYRQLDEYLRHAMPDTAKPFTIVVDRDSIEIFRGTPVAAEPIRLDTSILSAYDADFRRRSKYASYLERLVEVWLDDVAHHWRFDPAPAEEHLPAELTEALRAA